MVQTYLAFPETITTLKVAFQTRFISEPRTQEKDWGNPVLTSCCLLKRQANRWVKRPNTFAGNSIVDAFV